MRLGSSRGPAERRGRFPSPGDRRPEPLRLEPAGRGQPGSPGPGGRIHAWFEGQPHRATAFQRITRSSRRNFSSSAGTRRILMASAAQSSEASQPRFSPIRASAWRSLGRQKPPKPMPARKNAGPIRESRPMPRVTVATSAPVASQRSAMRLAKEILVARNEFEACLINSALGMSVAKSTGAAPGGQFP